MKLIKFSASWCNPCKVLSSTMSTIQHPLIHDMYESDIENDNKLAIKYQVRSIPTLLLVEDNGMELRRLNGNATKQKVVEFLA